MNKLKILLYDLKSQNKEFQEILNNLFVYDAKKLFKDIFSINTYTNTDMYNFLSIYELYDQKEEDVLKKIVGLKFFQGEKDTDQVILKYFQVLTKSPTEEISFALFERFIILLNSPLFSYAINNEIFKYFQIFLSTYPEYFDRGIYNLKDDVLKYKLLMNSCDIKYVFNVPNITLLMLENTKSKYILSEYFEDIPKGYISSLDNNTLIFLYFNFDFSDLYRDLCFLYFNKLSLAEKIEEFKKCTNCMQHQRNEQDNCITESLIDTFNTTKDITKIYDKYKENTWGFLRYHPFTNLKTLGEFLCHHKNLKFLQEFTNTFDFSNMDVLVALRLYLNGFYLVGESQIIHRVLEIFSSHYVRFNNYNPDFILNLSFSLLLLNTKMYNPNIKSRPTFEEYLSDFDSKEIPEDIIMINLYTSIKSNKINIPERNEKCLSHYEVYKKLVYNLCLSDAIDNNYADLIPTENNIVSIYLMDKSLAISDSILNTSHEKFFELCKYSSMKYLSLYLKYNRSDPYRFLNVFKHYLSYEGDIEIYRIFVRLKTKKYKNLISEIINVKLDKRNCEILKLLYLENKDDLLLYMIENNIENISNINFLDFDTQIYLMNKKLIISLVRTSQFSIKLLRNVLTANPRFINDDVLRLFKEVDDFSDDSFYTMIILQKEEDMFDYAIKIEKIPQHKDLHKFTSEIRDEDLVDNINNLKITNNANNQVDNNGIKNNITFVNDNIIYRIIEKYNLEDNTKLFHFYSSSKYILNQGVLKRLISNGICIRDSDIVNPSNLDNRLIYLIMKCDNIENKELVNYTLWIINLLCTSLPVFIGFFARNPLLINGPLQVSIIKIFISRLKKVTEGLPLCCKCQYNRVQDIDCFISKLVDDKIINKEDMDFWYQYRSDSSLKDEEIYEKI